MSGCPQDIPYTGPDAIASLVSYLTKPESYFITGMKLLYNSCIIDAHEKSQLKPFLLTVVYIDLDRMYEITFSSLAFYIEDLNNISDRTKFVVVKLKLR